MAYKNLSVERKKAISQNAKDWLKKNRVGLISNVRPETKALFDAVHEKLKSQGAVKSREDTLVYLLQHFSGDL